MKINYEKSEIYSVGLSVEEQLEAVHILGCQEGHFPMKYLGMPVSPFKISKAQLSYTEVKAEKRLGTWQCEYLSSGGKSTLIEACLSSTPMYTMGVYQLYEGNFQKLDSIRSRFYWQGTSKKRKYHMIKWEALNSPKDFGGLGFLDVRVMNTCLLAKWIDRLEKDEDNLCCSLLRNKYLGSKSIFQVKNRNGSQFWRSLLDVREWYQRGHGIRIKSGVQTRFEEDSWLGDCPLKIQFPKLYGIARYPDLEVSRCKVNNEWNIEFRRQFNAAQLEEWERLLEILEQVTLVDGRDEVVWLLEKSQKYTSKSVYRFMTSSGMIDTNMRAVWKSNVPLKVKIFVWMAAHDRIQCGVQLKKKQWTGPEKWLVCDTPETTDHIIFQCPIAIFLWAFLRDGLNWAVSPTSCDSMFRDVIRRHRGDQMKLMLFICAGAMWTIWKTRNDLVFNKKTLPAPATIIYKLVTLLKTWSPLLKPKIAPMAEDVLQQLSLAAANV
jgi:hypothetical protein